MPIWFELIALALAAYAIGLLLGWVLWGRGPDILDSGAAPTAGTETQDNSESPST